MLILFIIVIVIFITIAKHAGTPDKQYITNNDQYPSKDSCEITQADLDKIDLTSLGLIKVPRNQPQETARMQSSSKPPIRHDAKFGPYRILDILSGDTILVEIGGHKESVRLLGVDIVYRVENIGANRDGLIETANQFLRRKYLNEEVYIEIAFEEGPGDGRLLGFVFSGDKLINEELIYNGLAVRKGNTYYDTNFCLAEMLAQDSRSGIWR